MNYKHKIGSVLLVGVLFIASIPTFAAPSTWAREGYFQMQNEQLSSEELLTPTKLQQNITREEFAELAVRTYAKGKKVSTDVLSIAPVFDDTDNPFVAKAYHVGIVSGVGEGKFAPTNNVTRQEMAVMLAKELNKLGVNTFSGTPLQFKDQNQIASWAQDAVRFCVSQGILSGIGDNNFGPTNNATREQALVMMSNTAQKYGWTTAYTSYSDVTKTNTGGLSVPYRTETQLTIYAPSSSSAALRMESSGLVSLGQVLDMKTQHRHLVGVVENDPAFAFTAVKAFHDQLQTLWDATQRKYTLDADIYITSTGVVRSSQPSSGAYLHLSGTSKLQVDIHH